MTSNSRTNCAAILKDVVAYVDVWSSSKTENYSRPFIQQLQDMGVEVSKTFNKQVTHVVFKNGHQATWNKAKKTGVKLVSVLWVARCKDDGEHVNEELCPALNDEVNPALKKRMHRCMQPRDTPQRTPENDRRLKKKLDKMIKDLVPKSPLITDVSPYIIDEENGIVYSPSMKRSESMAQRLKEMREKRENLSPTASQIKSRLSPELKPPLGNTPSRSFLQQLYEEPDEDFNVSVGSNKTDGEKQHFDTIEIQHKKDFQKPSMSPCSVVPRQKTSPLPNSPAKEKANKQDKNPKRTSIKIVGRGTAYAATAGVPDTISDNLSKQKGQVNVVEKSMDKNTKTLRTLVMTSMPTEKQHTVTQVVRALGGFSVVAQVCESTTHVVSGGHRRTLNILLGIARGCWILSFEWILWCLEQRQWIPEEPYELSDQFPAASICRLQQHLSAGEHQQDLFLGQPAMFVSRNTQPPTHSLVELIQLCGGTVCKTVRQTGLCIGEYNGKRPEGSRILSEQWVLDCITHLKQLPYEKYDLEWKSR
ncbi:microcephalin-like isoform X5 [Oncorhynchus masou masou]|uniref:microcephalin-like isoform X5 n=1 Tax=Oncorhynchus masou masou TaxID=90313 RepID=UPI0031839F62